MMLIKIGLLLFVLGILTAGCQCKPPMQQAEIDRLLDEMEIQIKGLPGHKQEMLKIAPGQMSRQRRQVDDKKEVDNKEEQRFLKPLKSDYYGSAVYIPTAPHFKAPVPTEHS